MNALSKSERRAASIAQRLAADPDVLKNVKESTQQFRERRTVPIAQLGRRPLIASQMQAAAPAAVSSSANYAAPGPRFEDNYLAVCD